MDASAAKPILAARTKTPEDGRACLGLGFDHLEITLPCPGGPDEEAAWAALAAENQVVFLGHGPQEGDSREPAKLERIYLPRLREATLAAVRLGVRLLTVHCWIDSRWTPADLMRRKIALLAQAAAGCTAEGIQMTLENLSEPWKDLEAALTAVPDLGLTLDVGHAQLLSRSNRSIEIIEHGFDRIRHLHLHDNLGGTSPKDDLHMMPGRGITPFAEIFGALKSRGYDRTATLELGIHELIEGRRWVKEHWDQS